MTKPPKKPTRVIGLKPVSAEDAHQAILLLDETSSRYVRAFAELGRRELQLRIREDLKDISPKQKQRLKRTQAKHYEALLRFKTLSARRESAFQTIQRWRVELEAKMEETRHA